MKIESNVIHFVSFINVSKIVSQRAERAGPGRKKVGPCAALVCMKSRKIRFAHKYSPRFIDFI